MVKSIDVYSKKETLRNYSSRQLTPKEEAEIDKQMKTPLIEQFEKEGHPYYSSARWVSISN